MDKGGDVGEWGQEVDMGRMRNPECGVEEPDPVLTHVPDYQGRHLIIQSCQASSPTLLTVLLPGSGADHKYQSQVEKDVEAMCW